MCRVRDAGDDYYEQFMGADRAAYELPTKKETVQPSPKKTVKSKKSKSKRKNSKKAK